MATLYSSHIFMFAFRFDWNEDGFDNEFKFYKDVMIDDRIKDLKSFDGWELEKFDLKQDIENHKNYMYNEYAYFYDYARDAIYNIKDDDSPILYYFKKKVDDAIYEIAILNKKTYMLNIVGLSLRIFTTGVGILSIELENRNKNQSSFEDILKINDFGRRVYPQYIGTPKKIKITAKKIPKRYYMKPCDIDSYYFESSIIETKKSFLANSIQITSNDKINITENFKFQPENDIKIGDHILKLLGDSFTQDKKETKKYYIQPILDDRMFVLSWYGNNEISNELKTCHNYKSSDNWYKYLFIDGDGATVQNHMMKEDLLKKATYPRWTNYGTFWGVTRYSMVLMTDESDFAREKLKVDLHTMYFQMITLLLAIRTSILRFSDEVAAIASEKNIDRLEKLYEKYLTFYNRFYFKEVTHQDQGIELYDMARKQMCIDDHIKKLDNKFTKLFEFANLKESALETKAMNELSLLVAALGIPALVLAVFSIGVFDYNKSWISLGLALSATILSGIISFFGMKLWIKCNREKK